MIRFVCPACNAVLKAPVGKAGCTAGCPRCGRELLIPSPEKPLPGKRIPESQTEAGYAASPPPPVRRPVDKEADAPLAEEVSIGACAHCRRELFVHLQALGRWMHCPHCGMGQAAIADPPIAPPGLTAPPVDEEYREPRSRAPLYLLGGAGVLLLVALIVAVAVAHRNRAPKAGDPTTRLIPIAPQDAVAEFGVGPMAIFDAVFGYFCVLGLLVLAYGVGVSLILVWVVRDARARSIDSGGIWVIVILATGVLGLLIYRASRPYGTLVVCTNCKNKRLEYAKACPHCGST